MGLLNIIKANSAIKVTVSNAEKLSSGAENVIRHKADILIDKVVNKAPYSVQRAAMDIEGKVHEGYRYQFLGDKPKNLGDEYFLSAFKAVKLSR